MIKKISTLILILCLSYSINAAILFEDNFDSHDDWSPTQGADSVSCYPCESMPDGYAGFRLQGTRYAAAGYNTLNINSDNNVNPGTGKALTYWNESSGVDGNWSSDGLLLIKLPSEAGYDTVYIRFFIKFDPNWKWWTGSGRGNPAQKIFRIGSLGSFTTSDPWTMTTDLCPMVIDDLYKPTEGYGDIAYLASYRYPIGYYGSPDEQSAYFGDGYWSNSSSGEATGTDFTTNAEDYRAALIAENSNEPPWSTHTDGMMGDGEWHLWEIMVKMNSAEGVADGEHAFWQDGIEIYHATNIPWRNSGASDKKFNFVMIGGNNNNNFALAAEQKEQWYAIDDIIIATTFDELDGISATISGTVKDNKDESDMRTAGLTLVIDITGDTLNAFDNTIRAAILAGLNSSVSATGTNWASLVEGNENSWGNTGVVRTDDDTITITFPDFDGDPNTNYDNSQAEVITVIIPASALVGGEAITATGTFTIGYDAPDAVEKVGARVGQGSIGMSVGQGNIGVVVGD